MKKIERKSLLYKTGVEYGDYTINHVQGCAHGCKFPCYAMMMAKRFGKAKTYEEWCEPKLAENALEILDKEIPKLKDKIESVHLCFSTDPFMYGYDEVSQMSIAIIEKLNAAGIKCTALTKGILPIKLAQFSHKNEYGITLVSLDEGFRKEMEPNTASYKDRIAALRALHDAGCKTLEECRARINIKKQSNTKKANNSSQKSKKSVEAETPKYADFNSEDALMRALERSYGEDGGRDD